MSSNSVNALASLSVGAAREADSYAMSASAFLCKFCLSSSIAFSTGSTCSTCLLCFLFCFLSCRWSLSTIYRLSLNCLRADSGGKFLPPMPPRCGLSNWTCALARSGRPSSESSSSSLPSVMLGDLECRPPRFDPKLSSLASLASTFGRLGCFLFGLSVSKSRSEGLSDRNSLPSSCWLW